MDMPDTPTSPFMDRLTIENAGVQTPSPHAPIAWKLSLQMAQYFAGQALVRHMSAVCQSQKHPARLCLLQPHNAARQWQKMEDASELGASGEHAGCE